MNLHFVFIFIAILLLSSCKIDARKSSGSRKSGSSSSGSSSHGTWSRNPTSRPSYSQSSGGSKPGHIGWNVPKQPTSVNKPSAPNSEHISKTSATNVQSSGNWQPSGGYGQNTGGAFGQQSRNPSAPYPQSGSNSNPSMPHSGGFGTSGGHPPNYGTPGGHPPNYGTPGGHSPNYGTPGGHPPNYGTPGGYQPNYGTPGGQPPNYATAMGHPPSYGAPGGYHPQQYGSHNPPPYQPNSYNPSYGHSYTPGAGYNPPVGGFSGPQTILVQSGQSSRPGIGQLAKEAFVFAGVSAGVNAVVNRVLPGGIHNIPSHSYGSAPVANGVVPGATHTEITYNNYYNNGTPAAAAPAPAVAAPAPGISQAAPAQANPIVPEQNAPNSNANAPAAASGVAPAAVGNVGGAVAKPVEEELKFTSPMGRETFKHEIEQLSEELLTKDINNAFKYITLKLQGQKTDGSVTDDATDNLLTVSDAAWEIPTIKAVLALHDNYELDSKVKEDVSEQERDEENTLVNAIVDTDVMKRTMNFLVTKGYISDDVYEFKNALKRIWFTQFKKSENDAGSSSFETVFLAEKFESEIIGLHNWIYYAKKEADKSLNYLGYIKHTSLGDKGAVVKVRSRLNDTPQDVTTLFVGTSPELEMSLYTMCFYISPNYPCPIKLAGNEFIILTSRVIYFDKDILVSAYPELWLPPPPPLAQSSINTNLNTQNTNNQPTNSDMSNRRLTTSGSLLSGGESRYHSTLFITQISCMVLLMLIKFF